MSPVAQNRPPEYAEVISRSNACCETGYRLAHAFREIARMLALIGEELAQRLTI